MRDAYLNDIGDYVKYALLRELAGTQPNGDPLFQGLGVLWYLTVHGEDNNDGTHRGYLAVDGYAVLDPSLFAAMRSLERAVIEGGLERGVGVLEDERAGREYLPGARLHSSPLDWIDGRGRLVLERRRSGRRAWWDAARLAVADCPVVFLDPDNGLRPPSVKDGDPNESKYCRRSEVVDLVRNHGLVVVYQHANRLPWQTLRSGIVSKVREDLRTAGENEAAGAPVHTLVASTFGRRGFICFARTAALADKARAAISALATRASEVGCPLRGKLLLESDFDTYPIIVEPEVPKDLEPVSLGAPDAPRQPPPFDLGQSREWTKDATTQSTSLPEARPLRQL